MSSSIPLAGGPAAAVPRPASTLILLRDSELGPEVLLLRRHGLSDVHGGAFVFPGGKVDAHDAQLASHIDTAEEVLHERLGDDGITPPAAAAFFVAALREAFEESGLLLAEGWSAQRDAELAARHKAGTPFNQLVREAGLRLRAGALAPWSRWITPTDVPKRFDTHFFVARAPEGVARHDEHETTEAVWVRPRSALETCWRGEMQLAGPQVMTLAHLSRYETTDAVLAEARSRRPLVVAPHVIRQGDTRVVCYPGDEIHPVRARAMPGPLRMLVRNGRYEPVGGFEALFA